jgi:hypothetical protein
MVKVAYAFFPQKWTNLIVMTIWSYSSNNRKQIRSLLGKNALPSLTIFWKIHFSKWFDRTFMWTENDFVQRTLRGRRSIQAPPIGQKLCISLYKRWIFNLSLGYVFQLNTVFFLWNTLLKHYNNKAAKCIIVTERVKIRKKYFVLHNMILYDIIVIFLSLMKKR